jgi:glycine betaine/choline ABC-type transport system substrate-binding protein
MRANRANHLRPAAALTLACLVVACLAAAGCEERIDPVDIGSKNFTENMLLAEMMAQLVQQEGVPVKRSIPLGSTFENFESLKQGIIDLYPDYNGTGLILLGQTPIADGDEATARVEELYGDLGLDWLPRFGFSNDYVLAMRPERAAALGIETIADLGEMSEVSFAIDEEFAQRPIDGLGALVRRYGLREGEVLRFPNTKEGKDQIVQALLEGEVEVAELFRTDGYIAQYEFTVLEDDLAFFPVYQAAPLVRRDTLARFPRLSAALERLEGQISADAMREMNAAVEFGGEAVETVAARFLAEQELLPEGAPPAAQVEDLQIAVEAGSSLSGAAGVAWRAARTVFPERAVEVMPAADPVAAVESGAARLGVATSEAFFAVDDGQPVRATSAEALGVLGYELAHLITRQRGPASLDEVGTLGVGEEGAGADRIAQMVLAGLGLEDEVSLVKGGAQDLQAQLEALRKGLVDALLVMAPQGDPTVADTMRSGDLRLLPLGAWTEGNAAIRFSFLRPARIPAGVYPGQTEAIDTISAQIVLVGPSSQREAIGAQGPNTVGAAPTQPLAATSIRQLNEALGSDELVHPALPTAPALRPELATDAEQGITIDPWAALVNLVVLVLIGYLFYLLVAKPRHELERAAGAEPQPPSVGD